MPIYGYQCQACQHVFELIQKMSDPAPAVCPVCGKPEVRKQLSAAGFQLKGTGWYATDFKGGKQKSADKDTTTVDKPGESSAGKDPAPAAGKPDVKPEKGATTTAGNATSSSAKTDSGSGTP